MNSRRKFKQREAAKEVLELRAKVYRLEQRVSELELDIEFANKRQYTVGIDLGEVGHDRTVAVEFAVDHDREARSLIPGTDISRYQELGMDPLPPLSPEIMEAHEASLSLMRVMDEALAPGDLAKIVKAGRS